MNSLLFPSVKEIQENHKQTIERVKTPFILAFIIRLKPKILTEMIVKHCLIMLITCNKFEITGHKSECKNNIQNITLLLGPCFGRAQ